MRHRAVFAMLGACLIALLPPTLTGCDDSGGPDKEVKGTIGVSVLTLTNPFFVDLTNAIREEAARHDYEVIITAGEFNASKQKDQVNDFIVKQVDAIILCPCDSKAIGTSIAEANRQGIPVFTADIACLAEGVDVECHVASDNLGGGRKAAEAVIEMLDGTGEVAIIDYSVIESVKMRTQGFEEVIGKTDIKIVTKLSGGGKKEKSFKAMQDILLAHPEVDGIFAINDPSGLGAVAELQRTGRSGEIKIVGFDAMPEGRQAVKDGKLYATITQYPKKIGKTVAKAVVDHIGGEEVPEEILIPCTVYRKAEADADPTLK